MIKVVLFAALIVIVVGLLAALPAITIDVEAVAASSAWSWIRAALYFLPMKTVGTILAIIVAIAVFRLIIALVKTVWDLLPVA